MKMILRGLVFIAAAMAFAPVALGQVTVPTNLATEFDTILNGYEPLVPSNLSGAYLPPLTSNMKYALQHDARWLLAGGTHAVGASSGSTAVFSNGAKLFTSIGNSFQRILRYYAEFQKAREMVGMVESMWKFMDEYRLRVNVYKLIPNIVVTEPGDPFGPFTRSFIIGFAPRHDQSWRQNPDLYLDNPYIGPKSQGMKLVEIKYPRSWSDIKIDGSIWGADDMQTEEFQARMLAGFYDGVTSASRFLTSLGVDNNMELAVGRMSPANIAARIGINIEKRIVALQRQRAIYSDALANPDGEIGKAYSGYKQEDLIRLQAQIDHEIQRLRVTKEAAYGNQVAGQQAWVERANFIHQVLAKLEEPERRLAIARLSERYKKFENAWANPGFMASKPEITGDKRVDDAIYLIWEGITIISKGEVPPPQPVSGGPAAQAQAVLTKSMYRQLTYEELAGIRQLLTAEYMHTKQIQGTKIVDEAKGAILARMRILQENAERLRRWTAFNDTMESYIATNPHAAWAMKK